MNHWAVRKNPSCNEGLGHLDRLRAARGSVTYDESLKNRDSMLAARNVLTLDAVKALLRSSRCTAEGVRPPDYLEGQVCRR